MAESYQNGIDLDCTAAQSKLLQEAVALIDRLTGTENGNIGKEKQN